MNVIQLARFLAPQHIDDEDDIVLAVMANPRAAAYPLTNVADDTIKSYATVFLDGMLEEDHPIYPLLMCIVNRLGMLPGDDESF